MAFRKWLIVLAVLAIVIPASAQQFTCQESAVNAKIRGEGLTELVGDILIQCSGGTANNAITANITVSFTQNVTSKIIGSATESYLLVDNQLLSSSVTPPTAGTINAFFPNELQFGPTALTEPGPASTRNIRITNVRLIAGNPSTQTEIAGIIAGNIGSFSIPSPTVFVAQVQPSLVFTASPSSTSEKVCLLPQSPVVTLTYTGTIQNTFRAQGGAYVTPGLPATNTPLGQITESGLGYDGGVSTGIAAAAGVATQGTRLYATFTNVPAGVTISVPNAANIGGDATAFLVGTDPTAAGTSAIPSAGIGPATISSPGGTAVWEITGSDNVFTPVIAFNVTITVPAGTPAPSTSIAVAGGYAPYPPTAAALATWAAPSSSLPIPRFINLPQTHANLLQVVPCVTNLLFPYVVDIPSIGWATGIALANTSNDGAIFGIEATIPQKGTCTEYYFGENAPTTPPVTPVIDSTSTAAGGAVYTFGVDSVAPGFEGYLIVRCNFQYGHGFAFITGPVNSNTVAQGYLALVIPDIATGRSPANPFPIAGQTGNPDTETGEQLGE